MKKAIISLSIDIDGNFTCELPGDGPDAQPLVLRNDGLKGYVTSRQMNGRELVDLSTEVPPPFHTIFSKLVVDLLNCLGAIETHGVIRMPDGSNSLNTGSRLYHSEKEWKIIRYVA